MGNASKSSLWIHCPVCGGKTRTKMYDDTVLLNFPLYCPKCKKEIRVNVVKLKMTLNNEPDS
jgi:ribosomal protein L44E